MQRALRWLHLAAVAAFVLLAAACEKSEPPPPPPARVEPAPPPAPEIDAQTKRLAAEIYVYALPLVLTDLHREADIGDDRWNVFLHHTKLPDASSTELYANVDFLYSRAWLDLAKEPVVVSAPDTSGRYYLVALLDAWTNVAASLGTRTTGAEKAQYAIVGPKWNGKLPAGVLEVRSPTDLAWLFGRVEIKGKADQPNAVKVQDDFTIEPLSRHGKRRARTSKASSPPPGEPMTGVDPLEALAKMDAAAFFTRFAKLLVGNPPAKEDAEMQDKIEAFGIRPGQPFEVAKLDAVAARSVEDGVKTALDAVKGAAGRTGGSDLTNGWSSDRTLGRWGSDYGKRAVAAWNGIGVNAPEDAIFFTSHLDVEGRRLDGTNRYVVHFDKGMAPPAEGFWSLSLYDDKGRLLAEPVTRYNLGSDDKLATNADGSLDVRVQHDDPGGDANWLPAPTGPFRLVLRIYWPKEEVVQGTWAPPGVRKTG